MQFFVISHFFFMKISLDIRKCICFLEKKCSRISEISFLPSLRTKLLYNVCYEIPCKSYFSMPAPLPINTYPRDFYSTRILVGALLAS